MKKRLFLALGLLCGMILPLSTQAHEDGIYTGLVDENGIGVITVIFGGNDTFSGVKLTIKMTDQTGYYYWGFNKNTDNSVWDDYTNPGTGKYMSGDGKMHGGTYGEIRNNLWGGGADTYENGFNPNPINLTGRQGPCDSGYHVPSRGERNALAIAWCNLDENCNARYSDTQSGGVTGDLIKLKGDYAWTPDNKLIYISRSGLGTRFKNEFSMSDNYFWSSSPNPGSAYGSWTLYLSTSDVYPSSSSNRSSNSRVRCLRNSIVAPAPQTFTLSFISGDVQVWSGAAISGSMYTGDVPGTGSEDPLPNMTKEGYEFDGWFLEGESEAFDFSTVEITGNIELHAEWTPIEYTITYLGTGDDYVPSATGFTIKSVDITLTEPNKTGYTFTGRSGTNIEGITGTVTIPKGSTGDRIYEANWEANEYTITIDIDGNETILTGKYGDPISKPSDPSKNGYKFIGWEPEFPTTMPLSGATVKAKWEKLGSSGGGGGGRSSSSVISSDSEKSTEGETGNQGNSQLAEQNSMEPHPNPLLIGEGNLEEVGEVYTQEFQEAYEFAHEKGITTMPTIQEANMDGKLTRIAMAKMLSQYAMNVLGQKPANIVTPKFNDVTDKQNSDYNDGVTLAYQLGIMGQNMPGNNFRPNDEVTRAEFATALSRMAYGTSDGEYKATSKYYVHHMEKLVKEGIITNDDPNMKELRGYVMIMLMRSAK